MMKSYYVLAPAGVQSGGPELCHQMCSTLSAHGAYARIIYVDGQNTDPVRCEALPDYSRYNTVSIASYDEISPTDSILIANEGMTPYIPLIPCAVKVLWWMSVDNYFGQLHRLSEAKIKAQVSLHLVQSEYARQFLIREWGIPEEQILTVSDYIHEDYLRLMMPVEMRRPFVICNPYKGYEELRPLIEATQNRFRWIPLVNMNRREVMACLQGSMIYVDFGNHPGKDRIPREAAASGCCIITNRKGSAAYAEDVGIPEEYKFADPKGSLDEIIRLMQDILDHFAEHQKKFASYREHIHAERGKFEEEVQRFLDFTGQSY